VPGAKLGVTPKHGPEEAPPGNATAASPASSSPGGDLVKDSLLYKEFVAERDEILRHKWLESEKAGHDIGFEKALLDWVLRYRSAWRLQRASGGGLAGAR
jgi:hypothetical protein